MESPNGSQGPSQGPDFSQVLQQAQATGDFDYVLDTAKKSHRMLVDFRDVIKAAAYAGKDAAAVAMGLNFLENMVAQSAGQVSALKQTEKATREAMREALKGQKDGQPLSVVEPSGGAGGDPQGVSDQGTPAPLQGSGEAPNAA